MIPLARPDLGPEARVAIDEVLTSGHLVRGRYVASLEGGLSRRLNGAHVLAVSSGTAALGLALRVAGVEPGDEVVIPDFTFPALSNVIEHLGGVPVTVDISLDTYNADADALLAAVTPRTRVVVPVHQFGLGVDLSALTAAAKEGDFLVVEDAACALGATCGGEPCGTVGLLGCFSFHPRKQVTTGEGGAVVTHDEALFERVARLSNHGMSPGASPDEMFVEAGWNRRLSDVHAAVAAGQLERLLEGIQRRRQVGAAYCRGLAGLEGVTIPAGLRDPNHTFQSFVVLLDEDRSRPQVIAGLAQRGIQSTIGSYAIHAQPHYRTRFPELAAQPRPAALAAQSRALALPMFPAMTMAQVERVVAALAEALEESHHG